MACPIEINLLFFSFHISYSESHYCQPDQNANVNMMYNETPEETSPDSEEQEEMTSEQMEQQRKDFIVQKDEQRKDIKVSSQVERAKEKNNFLTLCRRNTMT